MIGIEGESLRVPGINRLARDIAVPPGRISAIVNSKRAITADTALRGFDNLKLTSKTGFR
jgi:plasmid maintenance system antidote protein VapI